MVPVKQLILRGGEAVLEDVPAPQVEAGTVLVAVRYSCVSVGTELSGLRASEAPLWRRAVRRPRAVARVLETLARDGPAVAHALVQSRREAGSPCGYAAAGVVLEVGEGVPDLAPGDRVACAGSQCAHHAELVRVPRNLCVPVPEGLDLAAASTATLGAIALQGLRRLEPSLGECFVVVGLGLLGQLTVQLLRASGCHPIGLDVDPARVALARELGLELALGPEEPDPVEAVARLTDGLGADGVVITAATPSHQVVARAFGMCRKRGRVVLVGDVGLHLERADLYPKELDFRVSTSYGPGRYDRGYEEEGLDYPAGYVRWTENRNLAEYLRVVARGGVRLGPLLGAPRPAEEAPAIYRELSGPARPLGAVLSWPERPGAVVRTVSNPQARAVRAGQIGLAVVGAGSFAREVHLPNLRASGRYALRAIVGRTGHSAALVARQWGAARASTDLDEVLADPELEAVLIATRHDLHAGLALRALRAGKHVLVEKPLALEEHELAALEAFYREAGPAAPVLLTGYNRRFAPCARRLGELLIGRRGPLVLSLRMNAGRLPPDHWLYSPQGGGRNRGEACHAYDLLGALSGSPVVGVEASAAGGGRRDDDFAVTLRFADGSLGTLLYTASGALAAGKERLEAFAGGKVFVIEDWQRLEVAGSTAQGLSLPAPDKGHREELAAFARALRDGAPWPIPLQEQLQAARVALQVEERLAARAT